CSGSSRPPEQGVAGNVSAGGDGGSGGNRAAGGVSSSGDTAGGMAGAGVDSSSDSGSGGTGGGQTDAGIAEPDVWGDGERGPSEECEPGKRDTDCVGLGFEGGERECTGGCRYDTSSCTGEERCYDGVDNDGDARADCLDSDCQ